MTYLTSMLVSSGTLADAMASPPTPAQFSLPHSPVANASVMVLSPAAVKSLARVAGPPDTLVWMTLVFQFILMLVSLYALKKSDAPRSPVDPLAPPLLPLPVPLDDPLAGPVDPLELAPLDPLASPEVAPVGSSPDVAPLIPPLPEQPSAHRAGVLGGVQSGS